ncbi:MAG: hypothetical protein J0H68_01410 [Sphingobacteriia bacterium]|nr:hypothetical protein [Sphingobacteriia bacterium]
MSKEQSLNNTFKILPHEIVWETIRDLSLKDFKAFISASKYNQKLFQKFIEMVERNIKNGKFKGSDLEIAVLYKLYTTAISNRDIKTLLKLPMHTKVVNSLARDEKFYQLKLTKIIIHSFVNDITSLYITAFMEGNISNIISDIIRFTEEELCILRSYEGLSGITPFSTIANLTQLRDILTLDDTQITEEHIQKLHVLIRDRKTIFIDESTFIIPNKIKNVLEHYKKLNDRLFEEFDKKPINFDVLKELISQGANVNQPLYFTPVYDEDEDSLPLFLLNYAISKNCSIEGIKFLLDNGANIKSISCSSINDSDPERNTALNYLLKLENPPNIDEIIKLLFEYGASTEELEGNPADWITYKLDLQTPLCTTLHNEKYTWALKFIEMGANVNFVTGEFNYPIASTLLETYFCNDSPYLLEMLKKALDKGLNINSTDLLGKSAVHDIAKRCPSLLTEEKVLEIIELGFDINAQDLKGNTPLHMYLLRENYPNINLIIKLVKLGARLDIKNNIEEFASEEYWQSSFGINKVTHINFLPPQTPLEIMQEKTWCYLGEFINHIKSSLITNLEELEEIYKTLRALKNEVSNDENYLNKNNSSFDIDCFGMTPLHHIVFKENGYKQVKDLIKQGANIYAIDNFGRTALDYALGAEPPSDYNFLCKRPDINLIIALLENYKTSDIIQCCSQFKFNVKDYYHLALELEEATKQRIHELQQEILKIKAEIEAFQSTDKLTLHTSNKRKRDEDEDDNDKSSKRANCEKDIEEKNRTI